MERRDFLKAAPILLGGLAAGCSAIGKKAEATFTPVISTETPTTVPTKTLTPMPEDTPTPSGPDYFMGIKTHTIEEAKQILIDEGSTDPKDRQYSQSTGMDLASSIWKKDVDGKWYVTYQNIHELPKTGVVGFYSYGFYDNRVPVDGKMVDTTSFSVMTTASGHSLVAFKDNTGSIRVLVLDSAWLAYELR